MNLLAASKAEGRPAGQKERDVCADSGGDLAEHRGRRPAPQSRQPTYCGGRIARSTGPACTGMAFLIVIDVSRGSPARPMAVHKATAARHTRLVSSTGTPDVRHCNANGPRRETQTSVSCSSTD
jgi:hypothetical protein